MAVLLPASNYIVFSCLANSCEKDNNFDAKSGDEGKGGGSVSQSTAKNGRGGRSGSRVGGKGVSSKGRKRSD